MKKIQAACCNICGSKGKTKIAMGYDFEYLTTKDEFYFVKCEDCGHIYLENPPALEEIPVIYPASYIPYRFDSYLNPVIKHVRDHMQRSKARFYLKLLGCNASILEVGSGSGLLMEALRDFGSSSWRLSANDFNGDRLARLKAKGVELKIGDFEKLEFSDKYDCIIMNQTIEHLYDPDSVIEKCAQVLKQGGFLIIETPNYQSLDFFLFRKKYWGGYHIPRHFHIYNPKTLTNHLHKHNFRVENTQFLLSPSFWIQSLHHFFFDKNIPLHKIITVNNLFLMVFFSFIDLALARIWHTSNMRVIGRLDNSLNRSSDLTGTGHFKGHTQ